ncbi:hypothetical protein B0J14DRAFT_353746 [Halenospora varia]|nr:hypothetical protein B0J14DRAFT_353746 [Halenospora varia]
MSMQNNVRGKALRNLPQYGTQPLANRNPIHYYRALLRALSYFPDLRAREILREHARERFRAKSNKQAKEGLNKPIEASALTIPNRMRKVRGMTRRIEKANHGYLESMQKMLSLAYGREGKMRRQLVTKLIVPEGGLPTGSHISELIQNKGNPDRGCNVVPPAQVKALRESQASLKNDPVAQIEAFLQSHSNHRFEETPRTPGRVQVKKLKPKIPQENMWGRPFPTSRSHVIRKKWWAETLHKILPPLPMADWERLQKLATGEIPVPKLISRRSHMESKKSSSVERLEAAIIGQTTEPARAKGRITYREEGLETEEEEGLTLIALQNYQRTMRRLYASIWNMSPTMIWDEASQKWNTMWGQGRSGSESKEVPTPSKKDEEMFEGIRLSDPDRMDKIDAEGDAGKSKKKKKPRNRKGDNSVSQGSG